LEEDFFQFSLVPNKFPSGSQYVSQVLNVFPNMFSIAPHLEPICFGKCYTPFTNIGEPKGRIKLKPSILGSFHGFISFGVIG